MRHPTPPLPHPPNPRTHQRIGKSMPHREKSNPKHIGNSAHTTEVGNTPNEALQAYKRTSHHNLMMNREPNFSATRNYPGHALTRRRLTPSLTVSR